MLGKKLIEAAAGSGSPRLYIEDVMSTWLYTGNGSTQTITNGIDLSGEGGLVWIKSRDYSPSHALFDTERGVQKILSTDSTSGQGTSSSYVTSFDSTGFSMGSGGGVINSLPQTYTSWTFRKAPKFFDIVTYTGNGSTQSISHNLGSIPGFIIVKRTDSTGNWICWHRSIGSSGYILLNSPAAQGGTSGAWPWNNTAPTDATFTVGYDVNVTTEFQPNLSGGTYVAYLFAHDAGGFGDDSTESVIKCGSYNDASAGTVTLGWEPQFVLYKLSSGIDNWRIVDNMRGFPASGSSRVLYPNATSAESGPNTITLTPTGFSYSGYNTGTYIYIAIRRGPMKTPTSGTEVFDIDRANSAGTYSTGFPTDLNINTMPGGSNRWWVTRAIAPYGLTSNSTDGESSVAPYFSLDSNTSFTVGNWWGNNLAIYYNFRRAHGFFDVVAYTGTGSATTVNHNLGVAPELMIVKRRDSASAWMVYSASVGIDYRLQLHLSDPAYSGSANFWNATSPTSTVFSLGAQAIVNAFAGTYIAYLFATCPGVSKCFSFTGNGTSQTVDCGFASGAKFVLIKRTDSTGNWLVADTARGIVSGNDPLLYLNSTAAEITTADWIDPASSGFTVVQEATANANVSGASYIGLAIS